MSAVGPDDAATALEMLATALGARDFATVLVTGSGQVPRLTVASRRTPLSEDIYADRFYRWSWAEPICGARDPLTAASRISHVLNVTREPTYG